MSMPLINVASAPAVEMTPWDELKARSLQLKAGFSRVPVFPPNFHIFYEQVEALFELLAGNPPHALLVNDLDGLTARLIWRGHPSMKIVSIGTWQDENSLSRLACNITRRDQFTAISGDTLTCAVEHLLITRFVPPVAYILPGVNYGDLYPVIRKLKAKHPDVVCAGTGYDRPVIHATVDTLAADFKCTVSSFLSCWRMVH
jgi:hypothetical protein